MEKWKTKTRFPTASIPLTQKNKTSGGQASPSARGAASRPSGGPLFLRHGGKTFIPPLTDAGIERWVGLGVIADNLIHMGDALAEG